MQFNQATREERHTYMHTHHHSISLRKNSCVIELKFQYSTSANRYERATKTKMNKSQHPKIILVC